MMTWLIMPDFADTAVWMSLLTLTFLEIVLGVDNIIFISIVSNKLPENQQEKARKKASKALRKQQAIVVEDGFIAVK